MRKFFMNVLVFCVVPLLVVLSAGFMADGNTDSFYLRFTTTKQKSLILGTSKAAQGLKPQVFKDILDEEIFNYSFTIGHSPYGKVYYESILKKHKKEKGGVSIVTVDPWAISSYNEEPNNEDKFRENGKVLDNMVFVNRWPNYEYLFSQVEGGYRNVFFTSSSHKFLHKDGWLEISNLPADSASVLDRFETRINAYRYNYLPKARMSTVRLSYLIKTVSYLKQYGEVYVVRLPVYEEIYEIENELMPDFDEVIHDAIALSDGYLDMMPQNGAFTYTDGNHVDRVSAEKVSEIVAEWIKEKRRHR